MLHGTATCYVVQVNVTGYMYMLYVRGTCCISQDQWLSPKRVSRYRVPSCLPLSLKVRVGCEGDRGGIQESLKFLLLNKRFYNFFVFVIVFVLVLVSVFVYVFMSLTWSEESPCWFLYLYLSVYELDLVSRGRGRGI